MKTFKALTRVLLRYDFRDFSTLIYTFVLPPVLLVALISFLGGQQVPAVGINSLVSVNVIVICTAFTGIFAGVTHLALWRENGMLIVLRNCPISPLSVIGAQSLAGVVMLIGQQIVLISFALILGLKTVKSAVLASIPILLGYLFFFVLGVILGTCIPSLGGVMSLASLGVTGLSAIGGAMIPVQMMPNWVRSIATYTPIYHMREAISQSLIGYGTWDKFYWAMLCLLSGTVILVIIASRVTRWK